MSEEFFVVWRANELAVGDFEIYGQFVDLDGKQVGPDDQGVSVDLGSDADDRSAQAPRVVWNSTSDEFFVVWSAERASGEWEVFGRRVDAQTRQPIGDARQLTSFGDDGDTEFNAVAPDVAHDATLNEYLVVFSGEEAVGATEVFGLRVDAAGTAVNDPFQISTTGPDSDPSFNASSPAVAWNSSDAEFVVVWAGDVDSIARDISGRRVQADGTLLGVQTLVSGLSDYSPTLPPGSAVASAPHLAYQSANSSLFVGWNEVTWDEDFHHAYIGTGGKVVASDLASLFVPTGSLGGSTADPAVTDVVATADGWLVLLRGGYDGPGTSEGGKVEAWGRKVGLSGELQAPLHQLSSTGNSPSSRVGPAGVAGAYAPSSTVSLVVWDTDEDEGDLVMGEYEIWGLSWGTPSEPMP